MDWYTNAVLCELHRFWVTKRKFPNNTMLFVFKSVFVSFLIYGHEFWVMTERMVLVVELGRL